MSGAPVVIVGASAAGVSVARTLRAEGFTDPVILVDADPNLPYERPPLSKKVLESETVSPADIALLSPSDLDELGLTLKLGVRAIGLDAASRTLTLSDGTTLAARAIVLATGGRAARLPLPGADLKGVHVIRDYADAEALRADLATATRVAVIGGGLIGTEAAIAICRLGKAVDWIDAAPKPLAHILPAAIADHLIASHVASGVTLHASARLKGFTGSDGRVTGVAFADGTVLPADVVVLGTGMKPDQGLAVAAGLETSAGIHVNEAQETSAPGIYAAGDVASFAHEGALTRKRHEHWRSAEEQGANAARAILGQPPQPFSVPWFWSDQGAHHVEMAGKPTGNPVVRTGAHGPIVFELNADNTVAGVASVDEPNAVRVGLRLIQGGRPMDPAALADPAVDLRKLLKK